MSIRRMTAVWDLSRQKGSGILCMLAIADNANDDGLAWPEVATIARKTRLSPRHIHRLTTQCCDAGELLRFSRADSGRSNFYVVLLGLQIEQLIRALRKLIAMAGSDILSGVYPEAWADVLSADSAPDILSGVSENLDRLPAELSWGYDTTMSHPHDKMSGGYDIAVSDEPSLTVTEPSGTKTGGSAADPDPQPDGWLAQTRITPGPDAPPVESLSQAERAAIAAPVVDWRDHVGEAPWVGLLRTSRKATVRYPDGLGVEDVIALIDRFCHASGVDPPATEPTMRSWHAGAVRFLSECHGHLPARLRSPPDLRRRAMLWCCDLFFHERSPVSFITATSPHSMISSVPLLAGQLRQIAEATPGLAPGQLPDEAAIIRFYDAQADTKKRGGDDGSKVWKPPDAERSAAISAALYPAPTVSGECGVTDPNQV